MAGQPTGDSGLTAKVLATGPPEELEVLDGSSVGGWFSFDEELSGEYDRSRQYGVSSSEYAWSTPWRWGYRWSEASSVHKIRRGLLSQLMIWS